MKNSYDTNYQHFFLINAGNILYSSKLERFFRKSSGEDSFKLILNEKLAYFGKYRIFVEI